MQVKKVISHMSRPDPRVLFICFIAISCLLINAYAGSPGSTSANFLKLGVGARPVGMGEAFCGVADDLNSLHWNPAGLNSLQDEIEINFMQNVWFEDISYSYLAYGQKLKTRGVIGGSLAYVGYGQMDRTIEDGSGNFAYKEGTFTAADLWLNISYAEKVRDRYDIGIGLNLIYSNIERYSAFALALDAGFLWEIEKMEGLKFGFAIQHLGGYLKKFIEKGSLPLNLKMGMSYQLYNDKNNRILTALDVNIPVDNDVHFSFGGEYWIRDIMAIRLGYKTFNITHLEALAGLSAGMGFKWENYNVDFAYVPYGDLGNTYRLSIAAKF